ncbi:MAG: branched-chain amino acid ABC transporter permease [Hyphomicrobiales bacterium]|nr:branched-chain amino acid ABC transporter permease [Hyphomicrobiales bacterium]
MVTDQLTTAPSTTPAWVSVRNGTGLAVLLLYALMPGIADIFDLPFYLDIFSRVMILTIAAISLNFILGFGGMVSFGHAAYLGLGAYAVGILAYYDIYSGWIQWPVGLAVSALFALVTGAICLRTKGVYFIMITLAFTQMIHFLFVSLEEFGGDDGLTIWNRSEFDGLIDLSNDLTLYYTIFVILVLSLALVHRLVNSRFGMVIQGARSNEPRMRALGFPTYRYRLAAYVIAGSLCGLAGILLGNDTEFVSPSDMHWTKSGDLIIIVVLGGMGTFWGPLFGALAFLLLEFFLSDIFIWWHLIFGPLLILVVIFARGGIDSFLGQQNGQGR